MNEYSIVNRDFTLYQWVYFVVSFALGGTFNSAIVPNTVLEMGYLQSSNASRASNLYLTD